MNDISSISRAIDPENLVLVAALLASIKPGRQSYEMSELFETNFAPTNYLAEKSLIALTKVSLVRIDKTPQKASRIVGLCFQNCDEVLRDLIARLKNYSITNSKRMEDLVRDVRVAECQQFMADETKSYGLTSNTISPPHASLIELLNRHPSCEVYLLLWRAFKILMESDFRIFLATNDCEVVFERIIREAYRLSSNYISSNRAIKSFERTSSFKSSTLASVLFEYTLGCGDRYYTTKDYLAS